jgi:hypothetical protein
VLAAASCCSRSYETSPRPKNTQRRLFPAPFAPGRSMLRFHQEKQRRVSQGRPGDDTRYHTALPHVCSHRAPLFVRSVASLRHIQILVLSTLSIHQILLKNPRNA